MFCVIQAQVKRKLFYNIIYRNYKEIFKRPTEAKKIIK